MPEPTLTPLTRGPAGLRALALVGLSLVFAACGATSRIADADVALVDPAATRETRALFANLRRLAPEHVLFGHQDDLAYGVGWVREPGRSDVREVAGAYPAVYGWELGDLERGAEANLDGVRFDDMQRWIREGRARGGAITIAWHMANPVTGGNSWDTTRAVHTILPGGAKHALYRQWLDRFAEFARPLRDDRGRPIPLILRPFHEHTGHWFWWGRTHVTPEEYRALWRFTVAYLRDERGLHNLLYAYSTDVFDTEEAYLAHYPGDAWVDVLGFDDYQSLRSDETVPVMTSRLRTVVGLARARGKIAALTETGLEGVPDSTWWTGRLLRAIEADSVGRGIAYVHVWRNAPAAERPGHRFGPAPGHADAPDFVRFARSPGVLLEDELPDLYRLP
jgi:mannan endo-1,4-beta-mannosidase